MSMNTEATEQRTRSGRSWKRWLAGGLIAVAALMFAVVAMGAGYQAIATQSDARNYPPPGQLVDVGGYQLHIHCLGEGQPTVILDALFPGTVSNWAWVQPEIAATTRVCAYDRAGLGWSESGPEPRDAQHQAQELHTLLANAGVPGPYVMVGHSLGALSVRMFAEQYPDEVAGMVLVEGTNPDAWKRMGLPEGVGIDRNQLAMAPFLASLGIFRLGLISAYGDDPDLPAQQREELQAFFNSTKSLDTIRAVDASFSASLDQVRHTHDLGAIPLAVVLGTAGDGGDERLEDLFAQQAALSTNSVTATIEGATHAGLVDNQQYGLETSAIIERVVAAARDGQSVTQIQP